MLKGDAEYFTLKHQINPGMKAETGQTASVTNNHLVILSSNSGRYTEDLRDLPQSASHRTHYVCGPQLFSNLITYATPSNKRQLFEWSGECRTGFVRTARTNIFRRKFYRRGSEENTELYAPPTPCSNNRNITLYQSQFYVINVIYLF